MASIYLLINFENYHFLFVPLYVFFKILSNLLKHVLRQHWWIWSNVDHRVLHKLVQSVSLSAHKPITYICKCIQSVKVAANPHTCWDMEAKSLTTIRPKVSYFMNVEIHKVPEITFILKAIDWIAMRMYPQGWCTWEMSSGKSTEISSPTRGLMRSVKSWYAFLQSTNRCCIITSYSAACLHW